MLRAREQKTRLAARRKYFLLKLKISIGTDSIAQIGIAQGVWAKVVDFLINW
jgi:hypothetical protein